MRIGLFVDILRNRQTGIERFVRSFIEKLPEIDNSNEYTLIYSKNIKLNANQYFKSHTLGKRSDLPGMWFLKSALFNIKKAYSKFDLIHSPFHETPFLFKPPVKTVVTVSDITPYLFPAFHPFRRSVSFNRIFRPFLNIADKIIAVSENTKRDLVKHFKLPADKIRVIYHGMNRRFKTADNEGRFKEIKRRYKLPGEFILSVSTLEPRKNFTGLIAAYSLLRKRCENMPKLVIVGGKGWGYAPIFRAIRKLKLENNIIFTGYVDDEDLPLIYKNSRLFVFPSFYEGFGFPPLEAMASGTPVICSNTSSLPEVTGESAVFVNPYSISDIAEKIERVLREDDLRDELVRKGIDQAARFSWEKAARETVDVYNELSKEQ